MKTKVNTNISKANAYFVAEGKNGLNAWFSLYADFVERGFTKYSKYGEDIASNNAVKVSHRVKTIADYVGAIDRAVKKFGSVDKARKAHAEFVKKNEFAFADISNFMKFAPEGQRAKSNTKSSKRPETKKALMKAGLSAYAAELAMNICGVK